MTDFTDSAAFSKSIWLIDLSPIFCPFSSNIGILRSAKSFTPADISVISSLNLPQDLATFTKGESFKKPLSNISGLLLYVSIKAPPRHVITALTELAAFSKSA